MMILSVLLLQLVMQAMPNKSTCCDFLGRYDEETKQGIKVLDALYAQKRLISANKMVNKIILLFL